MATDLHTSVSTTQDYETCGTNPSFEGEGGQTLCKTLYDHSPGQRPGQALWRTNANSYSCRAEIEPPVTSNTPRPQTTERPSPQRDHTDQVPGIIVSENSYDVPADYEEFSIPPPLVVPRRKCYHMGRVWPVVIIFIVTTTLVVTCVHLARSQRGLSTPQAFQYPRCQVSAVTSGGIAFNDEETHRVHGPITALMFSVDQQNHLSGLRAQYGPKLTAWRGDQLGSVRRLEFEQGEVVTGLDMYTGPHASGHQGVVAVRVSTNSRLGNITVGNVKAANGVALQASWRELLYLSGSSESLLDALTAHASGCQSIESTRAYSDM